MTNNYILYCYRYKNNIWLVGNPKARWSFFYCVSEKCVRTLCGCTQVIELKHWGAVHVYTSSLLSSGSHGKSRRLNLKIGFFSGSLNRFEWSLRVRVYLLAVGFFYEGIALERLHTLCGLCQGIYAVK